MEKYKLVKKLYETENKLKEFKNKLGQAYDFTTQAEYQINDVVNLYKKVEFLIEKSIKLNHLIKKKES